MANLNRYKFTFGEKQLTLTTEHDNLFMEEIERVAQEKYLALKEKCRVQIQRLWLFSWRSMSCQFN